MCFAKLKTVKMDDGRRFPLPSSNCSSKEKGEIKDAKWNIAGDILKKCETAKAGSARWWGKKAEREETKAQNKRTQKTAAGTV